MEAIEVSAEFNVSPKRLYEAWLDGKQHTALTGGAEASVEAWVGGEHTAWDGYIWGKIVVLEPNRRIVQTWRTSEFPEDSEDSQLEVFLEPTASGTRLRLVHTRIPDGQGDMYRGGWDESYFRPMRSYFEAAQPAPKKLARKTTKKVTKKAAKKAKKRVAKKVKKNLKRR